MTTLDELQAKAGLTEEEAHLTYRMPILTSQMIVLLDAARDKAIRVMMEEFQPVVDAAQEVGETPTWGALANLATALTNHAALQAEVDHANHG